MDLKDIIIPFNAAADKLHKPVLNIEDCKFTENRVDDEGTTYEYCEFRYKAPFRFGYDDYGDHGYWFLIDTRTDYSTFATADAETVIKKVPDFFCAAREWRDDGEVYRTSENFANYADALKWIAADKELVKAGEVSDVSMNIYGWAWDGENYVSDENMDDYIEWSINDEFINHGEAQRH